MHRATLAAAVGIWACFAILVLFAVKANGATIVTTPGPYQEWVDASRVPTPPVDLEVVVGSPDCDEALGCAGPEAIYLTFGTDKGTFFHELGHEFDAAVLTDAERERFVALLGPGKDTMEWWPVDFNYDRTAAEWFADAYMRCARLPRIDPRWGYGIGSGLVPGSRLRRECGLIRSAA